MSIHIFGGSSSSNYIFPTLDQSSNSSGNSIVSDYMSIKNGSYYKLLKAYYAKDDTEKSQKSAAETAQDKQISSDAAGLLKASEQAMALDYETAEASDIVKSIKAFVDAYNDTISASSDENSTQKDVLRNAVWMTNSTSSNESLLSHVGIQVKSDNTLSVNEEILKTANRSTLKTLFSGNLSYASKIAQKATTLYKAALGEKNTGSAYTMTGKSYQQPNTASIFDSLT